MPAARVAADTNVVLRFLLEDSPAEARAVERFLDSCKSEGTRVFVSVLVLQECVWVLTGRKLARSKQEATRAVFLLARAEDFQLENEAAVLRALADWLHGAAEFSDYLIGRVNEELGYPVTVTLEKRKLKASPVFRSLPR
jgi:predicted nucleic-acid-binding protein